MNELSYSVARRDFRTGDVLLWRGRRLFSWVIRWLGRSVYSHAGVVIVLELPRGGHRVMLAESMEGKGCRLIPLSSALEAGGWIDWYRVVGVREPVPELVVDAALASLGQRYGWGSIWRIFRRRLVPVNQARSMDDQAPSGREMVCSEFVSHVLRRAGVDLVARRSDGTTEPGDLALSPLLELRGRLVP